MVPGPSWCCPPCPCRYNKKVVVLSPTGGSEAPLSVHRQVDLPYLSSSAHISGDCRTCLSGTLKRLTVVIGGLVTALIDTAGGTSSINTWTVCTVSERPAG